MVTNSSVCEKVLRPKSTRLAAAAVGGGEDGLVATMIVAALDDRD